MVTKSHGPFQCAQVHYKVNFDIDPDVSTVKLDDSAVVIATVFYRETRNKPATKAPAGDQPKQVTGTWKHVKNKLQFTPSRPGVYSIVLAAVTLDSGTKKATSLATFKINHLIVVA
jgi:hypothetical protein